MAWIVANPRRKRRRSKAKRRRRTAPKTITRRRKRRRSAAPKVTRRRRRHRRRNAGGRKCKRTWTGKHKYYGAVKAHQRRVNPKRRRKSRRRHNPRSYFMAKRHHSRRRRNPGLFSGLFAPVKQYGLGFAAGVAVNRFLVDGFVSPFVAGLSPMAVGPSKLVLGPVLANLGKKFLPKFGRHWDAMALYFVAKGIDETVSSVIGPSSGVKGFGSIGPTFRGIGSIGPTTGMRALPPRSSQAGLGSLSPSGETYEPYVSDGSY